MMVSLIDLQEVNNNFVDFDWPRISFYWVWWFAWCSTCVQWVWYPIGVSPSSMMLLEFLLSVSMIVAVSVVQCMFDSTIVCKLWCFRESDIQTHLSYVHHALRDRPKQKGHTQMQFGRNVADKIWDPFWLDRTSDPRVSHSKRRWPQAWSMKLPNHICQMLTLRVGTKLSGIA